MQVEKREEGDEEASIIVVSGDASRVVVVQSKQFLGIGRRLVGVYFYKFWRI